MPQIFRDPNATPEERRAGVVEALKSILGRYDVTFSFSESPKTDGKTVWLGNLDPDDESFETFALGHGIHEMMHVTKTDMSAFAAKEKTELTAGLINVLEDVRIDTYGMRLNRLYGVWRNCLAEKLEENGRLAAASYKDLPPAALFCTWLHAELMAREKMDWAMKFKDLLKAEVAKHLPSALLDRVLNEAQDAGNLADTAAVMALAESIEKTVRAELTAAPQATQEGAAQNPAKARFTKTLLTAQHTGSGHTHCLEGAASEEPARGSLPHVQEALYRVADPDAVEPDVDTPEEKKLFTESFYGKFEEIEKLRDAFEALFAGPAENDDTDAALDGDDLTEDAPVDILLKEPRLFAKRGTPVKKPSGHLMMLLDRSGSMGVERLSSAKAAVALIYRSAKKVNGITVTAAAFPGPNKTDILPLTADAAVTAEDFIRRFAPLSSWGATPIAEAIDWARDQMDAVESERKLLLIITDGDFPEDFFTPHEKTLTGHSIELAVLAIASDTEPEGINALVVEEDAAIADTLIALIKNTDFSRELTQ